MDGSRANVESGDVASRQGRVRAWWLLAVGGGLTVAFGLTTRLEWLGSTETHTALESMATVLAAGVAAQALVRYYVRRTNAHLLIGTAFLGTAGLDGLHVVLTSRTVAGSLPSGPIALTPWTWLASRLFLAVFLWISYLALREQAAPAEPAEPGRPSRIDHRVVYASAAGLTVAALTLFALVPLPAAYYPDFVFRRPAELLPGAFFLAALVGYWRKGDWRHDAFEYWLVAALVVNVACQVAFMPRSLMLFDAMFDVAHLLKLASYGLVMVGLLTGIYEAFLQIARQAVEIQHVNRALAAENHRRCLAQEELALANRTLEDRVSARTRELEASRLDALDMMADATEARQRAETAAVELRRSNADLEQFAYVASHDLQEPLRMVSSYTQLLARRYGPRLDEKAHRYIHHAVDGATRMQRMIGDLLAYSRVGAGSTPVTLADADEAVDAALAMLEAPLRAGAATVTRDPLPSVPANQVQLTQLFQNLIGNALKFRGDEPARVHLSARRDDEEWIFSVRDEGIGIDADDADRIFGLFQRAHTRGQQPGTGLGLALAKRIVDRHGGRIWVESTPGRGATFCFTMPASQSTDAVADHIPRMRGDSVTAPDTAPDTLPTGEAIARGPMIGSRV